MRLIYLIGLPGCGKTSVMRAFMGTFQGWKEDRPIELLDSHLSSDGSVRVLGKYEDYNTFSGTDRLSMAVQPKAIQYFIQNPNEVVVGEGDRLNSKSFFDVFPDKTIIHLTVSDEERRRRYEERGSDQSEEFISRVGTKVRNILDEYGPKVSLFGDDDPGCVVSFANETREDTAKIVRFMTSLMSNG